MRTARVHDRPLLDQAFATLPLSISGALSTFNPNADYESRLSIVNAIGDCGVELIGGALPEGGGVTVDNATDEIVVSWPAITSESVALLNPGFEAGDLTGYTYSTIGGVAVLAASSAHSYGGTYSAHWPGGNGTGGEGGIEVVVVNDAEVRVSPGKMISGSIRAMYNPNGHVEGSQAQARINWYDIGGNLLGYSPGFRIYGRGYNGRWTLSPVAGRAPANAHTGRLAAWGRARAGDVYFDAFDWDAQGDVGPIEGQYCIELRVRDGAGRTATWSGCASSLAEPSWVISSNSGGKMLTSPDGLDWSSTELDTPALERFFGGGGILSAFSDPVDYSDNGGITWKVGGALPGGDLMGGLKSGVYHPDGYWFMCSSTAILNKSVDGINYVLKDSISGSGGSFHTGLVLDNGMIVFVGNSRIITSADLGETWQLNLDNMPSGTACAATDGAKALIGHSTGTILKHSGTFAGAHSDVGSPFGTADAIQSIAYTNGVWVVRNALGLVAFSATGEGGWTTSAFACVPDGNEEPALGASAGLFVMVGNGHNIYTSTDGDDWTLRGQTGAWAAGAIFALS